MLGGVKTDSGTQKNRSSGGQNDAAQNTSENDGFGKIFDGKASVECEASNECEASRTSTIHRVFPQRGRAQPMPRRGVQRHEFCATTVRSDFTCSVAENMPIHYSFSDMMSKYWQNTHRNLHRASCVAPQCQS